MILRQRGGGGGGDVALRLGLNRASCCQPSHSLPRCLGSLPQLLVHTALVMLPRRSVCCVWVSAAMTLLCESSNTPTLVHKTQPKQTEGLQRLLEPGSVTTFHRGFAPHHLGPCARSRRHGNRHLYEPSTQICEGLVKRADVLC